MIDNKLLDDIFKKYEPIIVIHLAQAGVRYSITNPDAYVKSNLTGFMNILKLVEDIKLKIFYMQVVVQHMVEIQKPPLEKMIVLIILLVYMLPQKDQMS